MWIRTSVTTFTDQGVACKYRKLECTRAFRTGGFFWKQRFASAFHSNCASERCKLNTQMGWNLRYGLILLDRRSSTPHLKIGKIGDVQLKRGHSLRILKLPDIWGLSQLNPVSRRLIDSWRLDPHSSNYTASEFVITPMYATQRMPSGNLNQDTYYSFIASSCLNILLLPVVSIPFPTNT
jgi:hypothetical protein